MTDGKPKPTSLAGNWTRRSLTAGANTEIKRGT